jgi:hypothetical protein
LLALLVAIALGGTGCSSSKKTSSSSRGTVKLWPAPSDPMARARAAGLLPETHESFLHHVHAHLDVYLDGKQVVVPAGIGIDITNPDVKHLTVAGQPAYGRISECSKPCISPLHTHDVTGILHTESPTLVDNTLGQFFTEWAVKLDAECVATYCRPSSKVAIYVDGKPFSGDPRSIPLTDQREIAIVIGKPPATIPSTADFSAA